MARSADRRILVGDHRDDTFRGPARIAIDRATDRLACTDGQRVVISTVLDDESPLATQTHFSRL